MIAEQQQGPSEGRDHEFKMRTVGMVALLFFFFFGSHVQLSNAGKSKE